MTGCRQAKEFLTGCNAQNTRFLLSLSKSNLRKTVGILTGHKVLNYHLHKMGLANSQLCRMCADEPETARHFVCTCPALRSLRAKCLGDYYIAPSEQMELKLTSILAFITESKWMEEPARGT